MHVALAVLLERKWNMSGVMQHMHRTDIMYVGHILPHLSVLVCGLMRCNVRVWGEKTLRVHIYRVHRSKIVRRACASQHPSPKYDSRAGCTASHGPSSVRSNDAVAEKALVYGASVARLECGPLGLAHSHFCHLGTGLMTHD